VIGPTHKVVLCGQGADEPLGGYPRHMAERLYPFGRFAPRLAVAGARRAFGADSAARLGRALATPDRIDRYIQIFSVFPGELVDELVVGTDASSRELARAAVQRWVPPEQPADTMNELLMVDSRLSLADDLLTVGDHYAMYSSVELRVPFLDLALVDLIERMPSNYKVSALGERKWLYRQGAARRLPTELSRRLCPPTKRLQSKRGFSTPIGNWFDANDGLLARPESWSHPLRRVDLLREGPLQLAIGGRGGDLKRQRSVLYCLATWLDENRSARSAVA
jgi:asparagine synthase (glutamine-hydrolysing)